MRKWAILDILMWQNDSPPSNDGATVVLISLRKSSKYCGGVLNARVSDVRNFSTWS